MLSTAPSSQLIKSNMRNNKELENAVTSVGLDLEQRRVCRIAFKEYMLMWMKIATTNPEESLDELIRCTETFAAPYRSTGSEAHDLSQTQHTCNTFKVIMHSPVQKLPNKDTKRKRTRVENMRRVYMQCRAPEVLTPGIAGSSQDQGGQEGWEQEMDELVAWTHSLSFKELDDL